MAVCHLLLAACRLPLPPAAHCLRRFAACHPSSIVQLLPKGACCKFFVACRHMLCVPFCRLMLASGRQRPLPLDAWSTIRSIMLFAAHCHKSKKVGKNYLN
jgi:hypothetical protein